MNIDELFTKLNGLNDEEKKYLLFKFFLENSKDNINSETLKKLEKIYNGTTKILWLASFVNGSRSVNNNILLNKAQENYHLILKRFVELTKELKLSNSLEIANLYTYLLYNGFFSITRQNRYKKRNRSMIPGFYSLDIMSGIGVCINYSEMLKDIENECGYMSASIINKINNINADYIPQFKNQAASVIKWNVSFDLNLITDIIGNHAFTLIWDGNSCYIYDPTNLMLLNLEDKFKASAVNGVGYSLLKPYLSYYLYNDSKNSIGALDKLHTTTTFTSNYNRKDFILSCENCIELFDINLPLLIDYYNSIYNNITVISDEIKKVKKK